MSDLAKHCGICGRGVGLSVPRHAIRGDHQPSARDLGAVYVGPGITEGRPQFSIWYYVCRNGGNVEQRCHLCDSCAEVGLRFLRDRIDDLLGVGKPVHLLPADQPQTEGGGS